MDALRTAQSLIAEEAGERFVDKPLMIVQKEPYSHHGSLKVILENADAQEGPGQLLSLVHGATRCDLGTKIVHEVHEGGANKYAATYDETAAFWPSVEIILLHPGDCLVRKTVLEYLEDKLAQILPSEDIYRVNEPGNQDIFIAFENTNHSEAFYIGKECVRSMEHDLGLRNRSRGI